LIAGFLYGSRGTQLATNDLAAPRRSAPAYRPEIDGLRAIAVLSVLLFHLEIDAISGGFIGVDIFFVISGYLITRQILAELERGTFSLTAFYSRRVRRLGPALLSTLALTSLASVLILSPPQLTRFGETLAAAVLSISNVLFYFQSGYFDTASDLKPLLHTWSLAVEEQFYLLWPATLILLSKYTPPRYLLHFITTTGLISLIASGTLTASQPSATFFLTPFRVFELGIGALIVLLEARRPDSARLRQLLSLGGLLLIIYSALSFTKSTPFPGFSAAVPCLGAALIIFAQDPTATRHLLANRLTIGIGLISYSLYLTHWPVIVFYRHLSQSSITISAQLALAAASLATASLLYHFVEQPFRRPRHKGAPGAQNRRFFLVSGASAVSLALLAGALVLGQGWYWRLGPKGDQLVHAHTTKDFHTVFYGGRKCSPPHCETHPEASPRLYIVGDSHARALHHGLNERVPTIHASLWESAGCEFYSLDYIGETSRRMRECLETKQRAFVEIGKRDAPVLLTQHWASAYHDKHIAPGTGLPDRDFASLEEYADFVAAELTDVAALIKPQPLIILGGVPRFHRQGSPYDCQARPIASDNCDTSPRNNEFIELHNRFNRLLARKLPPGVTILSPFDALCDAKFCRNFDEQGMPLYSDRAHLSIWGSVYLMHRIKSNLVGILNTNLGKKGSDTHR